MDNPVHGNEDMVLAVSVEWLVFYFSKKHTADNALPTLNHTENRDRPDNQIRVS